MKLDRTNLIAAPTVATYVPRHLEELFWALNRVRGRSLRPKQTAKLPPWYKQHTD